MHNHNFGQDVDEQVAHGYEVLLETQDSDVEVVLDIQMVCLKCFSNFSLRKSVVLFSFPFWANGLWYELTNMKEIRCQMHNHNFGQEMSKWHMDMKFCLKLRIQI